MKSIVKSRISWDFNLSEPSCSQVKVQWVFLNDLVTRICCLTNMYVHYSDDHQIVLQKKKDIGFFDRIF